MADYYAVLKRTLSNFGEPSESLRTKIYDKARVTITRQLEATQPPISDETKSAQLAQLEDAIARMEAEYDVPDDFSGPPPPLTPELSAPRADLSPASETPAASQLPPEPVAEPEPEAPARFEPEAPVPPVEPFQAAEADEVSEPVRQSPETDASPASNRLADAFAKLEVARAGGNVEAVATDKPATEASAEITGEANSWPDVSPASAEPITDITFDDDAFDAAARTEAGGSDTADRFDGPADLAPTAAAAPIVAFPADTAPANEGAPNTSDIFDDPGVNEREAAALAGPPVTMPPARRKSGRGVLWFLLLIAALGLLFVFRQPLLGAVGVSTVGIDRFVADLPIVGRYLVGEVVDPDDPTRPKPVPTIRITPEPETVEPEVDQGKREQRLGPDGQEVDAAAAREDVGTLPPPTVPVPGASEPDVPPTDDTTPTEPEAESAAAPGPGPEAPVASTEIDAADAVSEPSPPGTQVPASEAATVAVAQSAILYEEGGGSRETRSDRGNVVWSIVQESPGNQEPAEPAIRAVLDVPERELKATITIRRNSDKALAASHLMEVNFTPAAGFSGQNVDEVLAVRMKPDERSQGSPLSVIPAKIAPGYFYVALDNLPAARERNVGLLRSAKWIDMPVEYVTGRRALLSLEKGIVGERVFSEALAAWDAKTE